MLAALPGSPVPLPRYEAGGTEELQIANGSTSTSSANKSAGAFKDCDVLTTVSLPARLTLLGAYAFADCSALTTVTFEEGSKLAEIGNLAFWNCGITDFVIPAGVTKLGTAKASDTKLSVFMGCKSLVSITLPDNYVLQWNRFLGCTSLGEIRVNPENVNYSAKDGVLFSKDGTTLVFYPDGKQDETYAIPKGTLVIGEKAFYRSTTSYARNLTGVTIPEGVTEAWSVDMGCVGDGLSCTERQVSICSKDSHGPYHYDVVSSLIDAAQKAGVDYAVDVYPYYGSDADAALDAGIDARHGLIGPGVYASHGYERSHRDGVKNTFELLKAYLG